MNQQVQTTTKKKGKLSLANQIVIGMVLGIIFGYFFPSYGVAIKPLGDVFLRMIKMIIVPLIFAGLILGIAGVGDFKKMGRLGFKTMVWFELATTIALLYGLILGNVIQPGVGVNIGLAGDASAVAQYASKKVDVLQTFIEIIPTNFIDAMAKGNLLQIVFFSCFLGVAIANIKEKGKIMVDAASALMEAMFKVTDYVMTMTPIAVFAFMAFTIGKYGLSMIIPLGKMLLTLYGGLLLFIVTVLMAACVLIKVKFFEVIRIFKQPIILAFTTSSSEAAMPAVMERLEKFGVPRHIVNFVIPTGYTFNMDGGTLYYCIGVLFIAQVYGIHLDLTTQLLIFATLMVTSKGIAGVYGAAMVVLTGTIAAFNLPVEGLVLLMGIDRFMDMARTVTNLMGNIIATLVVARWEKELPDEVIQLAYTVDYDN
ncbi:MAG: sodium:dicarboxylate symporter [Sporomusa sp.]|nr:sodium:dicarboxylate symporter [Sporomusa sp.]